MNNLFMNGFFTLVGAVIGSAVAIYVQLRLRKEKFKEVFYAKLFTAYQEVAEILWVIFYASVGTMFEYEGKCEKIAKEFSRLNDCLDKNKLFVSDAVTNHIEKFRLEVTSVFIEAAQKGKRPEDKLLSKAQAKLIEERYAAVFYNMRKELGVEKLAKDLMKTF